MQWLASVQFQQLPQQGNVAGSATAFQKPRVRLFQPEQGDILVMVNWRKTPKANVIQIGLDVLGENPRASPEDSVRL